MNAYKNFETLNNRCQFIFNQIQKNGPLTKNQLFDQTRIKLTTLNRDLKTLINRSIIAETDVAASTGGRKPVLYDVNPEFFYLIGIDISRTYTQVVVTNLKYQLVTEEKIEDSYNVKAVIGALPDTIKVLLQAAEIDRSMVIGIGIGIVAGFDTVALQSRLCKEFGVPILIDNGANAAVSGEHVIGFGKDFSNIAYIHCGVGIRTGVISADRLIRPHNICEDALGHMIVDNNGDACTCGNHGCVETYVSISNLTRQFSDRLRESETAVLSIDWDNINYRDVCHFAENNHKIARDILERSALYFGIGLSNFIRFLNPQLIILSGPLIHHSQFFYDASKKIALAKCHLKKDEIRFVKGGYFKEYSISIGAAVMVMEKICPDTKPVGVQQN
jgi:predicted NBD/HSP70 family sugar kinase